MLVVAFLRQGEPEVYKMKKGAKHQYSLTHSLIHQVLLPVCGSSGQLIQAHDILTSLPCNSVNSSSYFYQAILSQQRGETRKLVPYIGAIHKINMTILGNVCGRNKENLGICVRKVLGYQKQGLMGNVCGCLKINDAESTCS